jgi:hypothetical protein
MPPPTYPGSAPIAAPYYGIVNRHNILQDFTAQWHLHTRWGMETLQRMLRTPREYNGMEDYYRTNRYDIVTSYIRSFDRTQKVPICSPAEINNPIGRRLVVLLDQYVSIVIALMARQLVRRGTLSEEEWPQLLLRLGLVTDLMFASNYDPMTDALENGKQVVGLLANVHHWRAPFFKSARIPMDIATYNQANVDLFDRYLASDQNIAATRASVVSTLQATGLPSEGHARDLWNHHLASLLLSINREITVATNAPAPTALGSMLVANLFACSVHIKAASGKIHAFPDWQSIGVPA